jgi:uncharacterized protein (TIGR03000 family)
VDLPAEATLTIDDNLTESTSAVRRFSTPALEPDQDFHYTLKAQLFRDGRTVVASRRVRVRAGQEIQVTIDFSDNLVREDTVVTNNGVK